MPFVEPVENPKGFDRLNTRKRDKAPALVDELGELLGKERGGSWRSADIVVVALREAIEKRQPQSPYSGARR